jgi:DNA-binding response OmpR family regulator
MEICTTLPSVLGEAMVMQSRSSDDQMTQKSGAIEFVRLVLVPEGVSVRVNGRDLTLTYAEFLIMEEFVRHPYQVLNRERLLAATRDKLALAGGNDPTLRSVDTHIARIRAKLRAAGYSCIKTMRFVGYRFVPLDGDPKPAALGSSLPEE